MPILTKPRALIPLGIFAAIMFGLATRASAGPTRGKCHPFPPINLAKVKQKVEEAIDGGLRGAELIASFVGAELFPVDPATGAPVGWPLQHPFALPVNATAHAQCLYDELIRIVTEIGVPSGTGPRTPGQVFNDIVATTPTPGKFFKIKKGWIMGGELAKSVAFQAMRKVSTSHAKNNGLRLDYIYCITSSPWNVSRYGSNHPTQKYPKLYGINGQYLWPAFMPWNADAIKNIVNGQLPRRAISSPEGDRIQAGEYGLLWLPPIDGDVLATTNEISCAPFNWPDGSSSIDPPPELTLLLE